MHPLFVKFQVTAVKVLLVVFVTIFVTFKVWTANNVKLVRPDDLIIVSLDTTTVSSSSSSSTTTSAGSTSPFPSTTGDPTSSGEDFNTRAVIELFGTGIEGVGSENGYEMEGG